MGLTTNVALQIDAALDTDSDLGSTAKRLALGLSARLPDGGGGGQAQKVFGDRRELAGGAHDSLDLYALGTDPTGGFRRVKALAIRATRGTVTVGGGNWAGATALLGGATHTVRLPEGAMLVAVAPTGDGWQVASASADALKVTAGVGAATYEILVVGT